ncbi:DUF4221 family protein [Marivirga salinae]|uniref:DUF4221 family protein n=1 Tax=Marivirga salinarum TaxID=3059078 RepID=A0AA51NDX1_9BACT|nr:DUF4221 family protein [Marivirga sp. BDSF4-3]WMN11951.1 DUF4221 family protein [Marivirga sp. BDSF4-3]
MKYFFSSIGIILTIFFTSCNQTKENEKNESEIRVSIDSVRVDPKGEIIDTKYGLYSYGFDQEKKFMYKFNTNNRHGLEIIDMGKMELVEFIPFEVEGPNGTTSRIRSVQYISDNEIIITNSKSILIFNKKAKLQHKYPISENKFMGDSIPKDLEMESSGLFVPEKNLSFNLINEGFGYVRGFSKLDLYENTRQPYWVDELKKLDDYHISLNLDGRMIMLRTYLHTIFQDDKFILSHDMENEVYYYDLRLDSIIHKKYTSQLSANKNEVYGKLEAESREELGEIMSSRNKSIRFGKIVFDEERNQFYRFSSFSSSDDKEKDDWSIILTIFDKDLNQLKETDNIPLDEVPETYFVKDGEIYVYKNMEDELGFLVLSLS